MSNVEGGLDIISATPEMQAPTFNPDEVLNRVLEEMKGDDRSPGEVVQDDRYHGDWGDYIKAMAVMYEMVQKRV